MQQFFEITSNGGSLVVKGHARRIVIRGQFDPKAMAKDFIAWVSSLSFDPFSDCYQRAEHLFDQVNEKSVNGWLDALLKAYKAGQFDQEYQQLLTTQPEFKDYQSRLQQFFEITSNGGSLVVKGHARRIFIRRQFDPKAMTKDFITWVSSLSFDPFSEPPRVVYDPNDPFGTKGGIPFNGGVVGRAENRVRNLDYLGKGHTNHGAELLSAMQAAADAVRGPKGTVEAYIADQILMSVAIIINNVDSQGSLKLFLGQHIGPIPLLSATRLTDLLNAIAADFNMGGWENIRKAAKLISKIRVASFAIYYGHWNFDGIDVPLPNGVTVNLILSNTIDGKSILAFVQVYNTIAPVGVPGSPVSSVAQFSQEILGWINKSLNYLKSIHLNGKYKFSNGAFNLKTDMSMLVLVFQGSPQDTRTMMRLAAMLQAQLGGDSNIPIMMVWEDTQGKVRYHCIAACDKAPSELAQIACNMLGHPSDCNAHDGDTASKNSSSGSGSKVGKGGGVVGPLPPGMVSSCGPRGPGVYAQRVVC